MTLSTEGYTYVYPLTDQDCVDSGISSDIAHARYMSSMLEHPALQPPTSEVLEAFLQKLQTASGKRAVVVAKPWEAGWTACFATRNEKSGHSHKLEAIGTFVENNETSAAQLAGTAYEIARQWKHFKGERKTQTEELLAKVFTDGRLYDNCNEDRFMCVKLLAKAGTEISAGIAEMLKERNNNRAIQHVFSGLTCLERLADGIGRHRVLLKHVNIRREHNQIINNLNPTITAATSVDSTVTEQTLSERIAVMEQFDALVPPPKYPT